jgi:hypothetical protein
MGTSAPNYGHDNAAILTWLRAIDRDDPFSLTGAGSDSIEGEFTNLVQNPSPLAKNIYAFCPDFVTQGLALTEKGAPEDLIVRYFQKNRYVFFWWD